MPLITQDLIEFALGLYARDKTFAALVNGAMANVPSAFFSGSSRPPYATNQLRAILSLPCKGYESTAHALLEKHNRGLG